MELIDRILDKCLRAGADMAEVYYISHKTLSLAVRDGKVETVKKATPGGLAIRYYSGGKIAFAHTTDTSDKVIDKHIASLRNLAVKTGEDKFAILPSAQKYGPDLEINDTTYSDEALDAKIEYLQRLEQMAINFDPRISQSNSVWYEEYISTRSIVNTKGLNVSYDSTSYGVGVSVVASKDGQMYPGEGMLWVRRFGGLPTPEKIAEQFSGRAVRLIGGKPVESGDYEIIFAPKAANSILWGLSGALNGDNAMKGASFLEGKIGSKITSESLTLYDDQLMPQGIASRPADDEGVASMKLSLIEGGVLKGFMYDSRTAAKAKVVSTASAGKDDYSILPAINASNFYIAPGTTKVDDVISSCRKGIIVEETAGWGLQGVNGQYSAGINGILVIDGKKMRPVADVTIAGSADEILNGIGAICDDISYYDNFSSPSIFVKKMKVSS
jgi:PmbA protein